MVTQDPRTGKDKGAPTARVDCSGLTAGQVLLSILPSCLEAKRQGRPPVVIASNLQLLQDSVTRLLKAFGRLAEDFDARITLAESSGFGSAFFKAMAGEAHVDLRDDVA